MLSKSYHGLYLHDGLQWHRFQRTGEHANTLLEQLWGDVWITTKRDQLCMTIHYIPLICITGPLFATPFGNSNGIHVISTCCHHASSCQIVAFGPVSVNRMQVGRSRIHNWAYTVPIPRMIRMRIGKMAAEYHQLVWTSQFPNAVHYQLPHFLSTSLFTKKRTK